MKTMTIKSKLDDLYTMMEKEMDNVTSMCDNLENCEDHNDFPGYADTLDDMIDKLEDLAYEISKVINAMEDWTA